MKQNMKNTSRVPVLVLLLAIVSAPPLSVLHQANAQETGISYPTLSLRALGIDNEVRQITTLFGAQVNFFKRAAEHRKKGSPTPREARELQAEGDQRKSDLLTLKSQFESLINNLKRGNNWNEAFEAQFAASLTNDKDRSLLKQAGGARKLFEAAIGEISSLKDEIDDEVRQVSAKHKGTLNNRAYRSFAAHAQPPVGKVCTLLLSTIFLLKLSFPTGRLTLCALIDRYNQKGCIPGPAVEPNCN